MMELLAAWVTGGRRGVSQLRETRRLEQRRTRRADLLADWPQGVDGETVRAAVREHYELLYPCAAAAGRALGALVRHFDRSGLVLEENFREQVTA